MPSSSNVPKGDVAVSEVVVVSDKGRTAFENGERTGRNARHGS